MNGSQSSGFALPPGLVDAAVAVKALQEAVRRASIAGDEAGSRAPSQTSWRRSGAATLRFRSLSLVGDNGAGKPTLVTIICGVQPATGGRILIEGKETQHASPSEAQRRGIQVVLQDLAMAERQPVYMDLFVGRELVPGPLCRLDRRR